MKQRYHVHIYREMRLYFPGIEADSSEAAAELARNLPTADAAYTEDCDGRTLAALVDLDGDTEYEHTIDIDFDKRPEGPGTVVPTVVVVSVRGGIVEDIDATCPLVSKVHRQAERQVQAGRHILFIGHKGHPEVIGTFGQVPDGAMTLIETEADARTLQPADPDNLAYLTQTTLSVDDTAAIIAILEDRFPAIVAPKGEDICYATSNRQAAVKAMAQECDAVLVIGAPNSSNSLRLVECAERAGAKAQLIQRGMDIDFGWLAGINTLGITAGASAPEVLVREVVDSLAEHFAVSERTIEAAQERMAFKLPKGLETA